MSLLLTPMAEAGPEIAIEDPAGNPLGRKVIAWGWNEWGQCTVPVEAHDGVIAIAAGHVHSVALKGDGRVVVWGLNNQGQGDVPASALSGVQAIGAGTFSSLAVKNGGALAWGDPAVFDIGNVAQSGVAAIDAGLGFAIALKSDGSVVGWGHDGAGAVVPATAQSGVVAIDAGLYFAVALKNDGSVVAWGRNDSGELNVPVAAQSDVRAVAACAVSAVALKNDGSVIGWGYDFADLLTPPFQAGSGIHTLSGGLLHALGLKADGSVVAWGHGGDGQTTVPAAAQSDVEAIAAGGYHSLALRNQSVGFGAQMSGTTGAAKTIKVRNSGDADLQIASVTVIGANASDFAVSTSGMLTSVPGTGGETTFAVSFSPSAVGARKATLRVMSDDTDEGTFDIPLTGEGLPAPQITVFTGESTDPESHRAHDASAFTFPNWQVGGGPEPQIFTVKNTGTADLISLSVTTTNSTFAVSQPAATTLAPGDSTTFTIGFTPGSPGTHVGGIQIASNVGSPNPFLINVTGSAFAPALTFFIFTNGTRMVEADASGIATNGRSVVGVLTQPASGTVTVVNGRLRYAPRATVSDSGDSFAYIFENGLGGVARGFAVIRSVTAAAGDYDGLLMQAGAMPGPDAFERSGMLRVTVARTGAITGRLQLAGGIVRAFSGVSFAGSTGTVNVTVPRPPMAPVRLQLKFDPSSRNITGAAVSTDNFRNPITAAYHLLPRAAAGARAGAYTMFVRPDATPESPQGTGYAAVRITADGHVRLAGRLADGSPFSSGSGLRGQETFHFYSGLYPGERTMQGSVYGGFFFEPAPPVPGPAATTPVYWYKPYRPLDRYFPEGFTLARDGELFRYVRPAVGTRLLAWPTGVKNGAFTADQTGPNATSAFLTLPGNNTPIPFAPNTARLALSFDLASGLFSGSFTQANTGRRLPFFGAVCQPLAAGDGYFLGAGSTDGCSVELRPVIAP